MSFLRKALLAGISGALCYAVYHFGFDGYWPELLFYSLSGALFAAGVLFPYLRRDKSAWYRGFGLVAISALSYWSAIETAGRTSGVGFTIGTKAFLAASFVGAFIALTGARFIAPLHQFKSLAALGLPAAFIGGLAFALMEERDGHLWGLLAFSAWHMLMATAIYMSESWPLRVVRMG